MRSPGRPPVARREHRQRFWEAIARGLSSEEAAVVCGVSPAVGNAVVPAGVAGCHRLSLAPLSGRYLSFAEREEIAMLQGPGLSGCARSPAGWAGRRRRSRGSCAATPRPAAVGWSTGPRTRSGTPTGAPSARRPPSSPATTRLREYVQDRLAGTITAPDGTAVPRARGALDRAPARAPRRTGGGRRSWSPEQIANRLRVDFPDDESMRISHEAIYQALYVQGRGALRRELTACLRTGRALRVPTGPDPRARQEVRHPRGHDQRATRRGRGPGRARPLGRRPHPRAGQLRDRHAGRAHHPVHDAAAPAPHGRPRHEPRVKNGPPLAGHGAEAVRDAIAATITTLPEQLRRSLTWDQGAEMAQHAQLRIDTGLAIYFCDPHSPWQRGTNENTNGLLRQYFPKGTDLSQHTAATTSTPSPPRSTAGPARPSAGRHPPRPSNDHLLLYSNAAGVATTP